MAYRIFISSVQREFAKERKALAEYIRKDALLEWLNDTLTLCTHTSPTTDKDLVGYSKGIKAVIDKLNSM